MSQLINFQVRLDSPETFKIYYGQEPIEFCDGIIEKYEYALKQWNNRDVVIDWSFVYYMVEQMRVLAMQNQIEAMVKVYEALSLYDQSIDIDFIPF